MTATPTNQLQLPLRKAPAPKVGPGDVALLCRVLRGQGWLTAQEIVNLLNTPEYAIGWTDRYIRAVAETSDGAILSYPGSPGYKVFDEATEKECAHCDAAWASQIERMTARRTHYQRRHHKRQLVDI